MSLPVVLCCVVCLNYESVFVIETGLYSVAFSPEANYTERPPLVGEVTANFLRIKGDRLCGLVVRVPGYRS
jgi:hypothetical protein